MQITEPSFYFPLSIYYFIKQYICVHVMFSFSQERKQNFHSGLNTTDCYCDKKALWVASCLKQFDDNGLMGLQFQLIKRRRPQTVHSCAGHKHSSVRQAGGPGWIQSIRLRPDVEQNEEVDATPWA